MSKISKTTITVVLVIGCAVIFGGIKFLKDRQAAKVPGQELPQRAKGNPKAEVRIIEFIDFQCPACANGVKILNEYFEKHPGKMYLELRHFPLAMHRHGFASSHWSECAAKQNKFWPFFNILIERQKEWGALIDARPSFVAIAKEVGLDQGQMDACLQDKSVSEIIKNDVEEGKLRGVNSTPSYLINHEMVVGTKSLKTKLDQLLGVEAAQP